jgi:tripartite-type tricarboxylate transporter receptor subunit TctC
VLGILAATVVPMMPGLAHGQSQQPIRLNVPFSPGTGPDLLARILSEELRQRWNHPVIVENKPGASGNIGTQAAARTAPDGQNLLVTVNTFVMNASLYPTVPYDPEKDFVPWFIPRSASARSRNCSRWPAASRARSTTLLPAAAHRNISPWSCSSSRRRST